MHRYKNKNKKTWRMHWTHHVRLCMFIAGNTKMVAFRDITSKNAPLKFIFLHQIKEFQSQNRAILKSPAFLGHKYLSVTVYNPLERCEHKTNSILRVSAGTKYFSHLESVQYETGAHSVSYLLCIEGFFSRWPSAGAWSWPLASTQVHIKQDRQRTIHVASSRARENIAAVEKQ